MGNNRLAMFLLGATLALGFGWSAYMVSTALVKMRQENLIRVKGLADTNIKADYAVWQCDFWYKSDQIKSGYEGLEQSKTAVVERLKSAKIAPAEMSLTPVVIEMQYKHDEKGNKTNAVEFYVLNQSILLKSNDVAKIQAVSQQISSLIKDGVELLSGRPEYVYTNIDSVKMDLLAKATKNAYERAQVLAANSGGKVGALNSASQGVFQITPVNSTEVADNGCYDTSTIDKTVKCVVTLEFRVAK